MSSIITDDLLNDNDDVINSVIKSVEERTMLRQRRSLEVKVKLQEMNDRRNKLDNLRLGRLASERVYIDMDLIRNEIQKSLTYRTVSRDKLGDNASINKSPQNMCNLENATSYFETDNKLDMDIQKNIEQQDKLSKSLEKMQTFSAVKDDMDTKQVKPVRRKSFSNTTSGGRSSSNTPLARRKSISHDGSSLDRKSTKFRPVKRRGSVGNVSDRIKTNGSLTLLDPIVNDDLRKSAKLVKNALKIKQKK